MSPATRAQGGAGNARRDGKGGGEPEVISPWEWVVGALGLALVAGALFVMLRESSQPARPPSLTAALDSVQRVPAGYVAHVTVRNGGSEPVSNVAVEGTLATGAGAPEQGEATVDHLPAGATHGLGLLYANDPSAGGFEVRVRGFMRP